MATINLPEATGNGKYFTIANNKGDVVTIDGDNTDTIDNDVTYNIADEESITVVDFRVGEWAII